MPDPASIRPRLAELAARTPGWVDGSGLPLADGAVPWLAEWLQGRACEGMPVPHLYLTVDGELQAEWDVGRLGVEMTMDPGALDMQDPAAVAEWVAGWRARGVASA